MLVLCVPLLGSTTGAAANAPRCTIVGSDGTDQLQGKPGPDVICGGDGEDRISGGGGADRLVGGRGNDTLVGGPGRDVLVGGNGRDACDDSAGSVFRSCESRPIARSPDPPPVPPAPPWPRTFAPPAWKDEEPPSGIRLSFEQALVDLAAPEPHVDLWVEAWDPSGIGTITAEIEGPEGFWQRVDLEGGPGPMFIPSTRLDLPATTPLGDYRISWLTVRDREGNSRTFSADEAAERAYFSEFSVFEGPDDGPPTLTSLSLTPNELDTGEGPATVEISVGARDPHSGVKNVRVLVVPPDWDRLAIVGSDPSIVVPPDAGNRREGTWVHPYPLPKDARRGYYKIYEISLIDFAGNQRDYTRERLRELGYPINFLEAPPAGDTDAPEITDFKLDVLTQRTPDAEHQIDFHLHIRDDITGVGERGDDKMLSDFEIDLEPVAPWTEFGYGWLGHQLASGSDVDGTWLQRTLLDADAPTGGYRINYVSATDRAGNKLLLNRAAMESRGWPTTFVNNP